MSNDAAEEPQSFRQNLVDEAAKFLTNPNVASHAESQKTAFLQKKGLSKDEIQAAFVKANAALTTQMIPVGPPVPGVGPLVPSSALPPPPSVWIKVRDICNFVLLLTGASYGAYYLYKKYIEPALTGRKRKTTEESMMELQQSVVTVLKEVQTTLASLEHTLSVHSDRIMVLSAKEGSVGSETSKQMEDLKTEISTLKGLLINRRTFPSTPSMSPSIPSWQRTKSVEKSVEASPGPTLALSNQVQVVKEATKDVLPVNDTQESSVIMKADEIHKASEAVSDSETGNPEENCLTPSTEENGNGIDNEMFSVDSVESSDETSQ